jgi:hypothetical protein
MKNLIANSKVLKEFAEKYSQTARPFKREELENNEPITREDYEFERACESLLYP